MTAELTIEVERSGIWWAAAPTRRRARRPQGEPPFFARPVRGTICGASFIARPRALPLADASVSTVICLDVLEFVRDDDFLIDEFARILIPGGRLRLRVTAAGPLAALDAYNLMHYLVDTTHRGVRPYETSELGWRRHYRLSDLTEVLGSERFAVASIRRRRLGIAEAIDFTAMALFRWLRPNRRLYRAMRRLARLVERWEHRVSSPFGTVFEIDAIRCASAGPSGNPAARTDVVPLGGPASSPQAARSRPSPEGERGPVGIPD